VSYGVGDVLVMMLIGATCVIPISQVIPMAQMIVMILCARGALRITPITVSNVIIPILMVANIAMRMMRMIAGLYMIIRIDLTLSFIVQRMSRHAYTLA
jgi:hypothetical protein